MKRVLIFITIRKKQAEFIQLAFFRSIPLFAGSKPPPQDAEKSEEDRWGITARKSPIGRAFHQWGKNTT
ncbi:hypothetical protein CN326_06760, partial [Bacillus sp. AFS018417]|uniref:hypothetical protein n=1 Tax=Bacillus sp. AFS018417 TaxID=2033491 RepID=UPI000BF40774